MAWPYDEDTGPYGSVSQVPTGAWFGVDTATGAWQRPGQPTLAGSAGLDLDLTTAWPGAGQGYGVQAPGTPAIGQVTGLGVPTRATPSALPRPPGREPLSAFLPQPPGVWESIARGVGMATPQGRQILQGYDQQTQQGFTNRLALRRQQLVEDQEARQATQTSLETLRKISEMPNKTMRNLMFDRYVADMGSSGQSLPTDMVEAFKKSSLDEGKQMAAMLTPMFEAAGIDPAVGQQLLQEGGDPKRLMEMIDLGLKTKKAGQDAEEAKALQRIQAGGTLGDVSGVTVPAPMTGTPAPSPSTPAPTARAGPVSPVLDTAVTEATKLYPQVRPDLVHGIIRHESNYDVGAVSPKGATGLMQLMPGTAKEQGVDNPKDPVQNVRGGVRYFAQMLTKYQGNEALALAAYNWGPGNVDKVNGDLTKMPAETQAYVKNVLASAASGQRGPAGTQGQVAGPGAPAPTTPAPAAADSAALTQLKSAIAQKQQQIQQLSGLSSERANKVADNMRADLKILQDQHDRLEDRLIKEREQRAEPQRALEKQQVLEEGELRRAREARALTPIPDTAQKSLAANKSIYRSIGKVEQYFREGTDLPEDFVNQVAQDAPGIRAALQADPKGATGILEQWETKLKAAAKNDPNANRFLAALANMRDLVIRERSGGSVTGNELERAMGAFMGSLPNINQAFSLFVQNLANIKETVVDELVTAGASARPLAGGKAVYGSLPKEVRDAIDAYERGEEPPKATRTSATTTVTKPPPGAKLGGPVTIVQP